MKEGKGGKRGPYEHVRELGRKVAERISPLFSASAPDRRKKKITPCRMDEKIKKLHSPNPAEGRAVRNCSGKREGKGRNLGIVCSTKAGGRRSISPPAGEKNRFI